MNLTLYISEIVAALLETKYKASEVSGIVRLCIQLHRRYDDFTLPLINGLQDGLLHQQTDEEAGKRKRIQMRLLIELFENGLMTGDDYFVHLLKFLTGRGSKT